MDGVIYTESCKDIESATQSTGIASTTLLNCDPCLCCNTGWRPVVAVLVTVGFILIYFFEIDYSMCL